MEYERPNGHLSNAKTQLFSIAENIDRDATFVLNLKYYRSGLACMTDPKKLFSQICINC
jgi:hypothetical protein